MPFFTAPIDYVPAAMMAIGFLLLIVGFIILFPSLRKEEDADTSVNLAAQRGELVHVTDTPPVVRSDDHPH